MSASRSSFKHQHQPPQTVELPPFLHHHNHHPRYVPLPHHPPPPPPNPSDFYHRHHLPPPLPPPPPPPPPPIPPSPHSYRPLPPPPPYNPLHSQFTYPKLRPIDDDLTIFSPRSPPRVFDRSPFVHDRPRLRIPEFDNSWPDPPRVPPENRLHHHRPFDSQIPVSPFPTSDTHRNDLQRSFRFREDFIDGFTPNPTEEFSWAPNHSPSSDLDRNYRHNRNHHYVSNSSGSSRSFAFGDSHVVSNSNPSIDFGSNLGNYESRYGSSISSDSDRFLSNKDEYRRWDHARELPDAPVLSENNEFDNSDGLRVVSSRRVPHIYDSGKFNYRGSREGNQEFLQSPRKKIIQKKSALLRIQYVKSHNRNRNDEQRFSSTRYDDSDSSTFRSRGPFVYSDNRIEEDREGSPVELDVSFKSNALVAKAIVASSSHGVESDRNFTPRNRKIRKLKTPEIDLLNSPLTKLSDGPVELNSSTYALDCPTISYRDSKQLGENVMDSGGGAACAIGTQPCSSGAIDTSGNSTLKESVSEKGGNSVGSDGTSSLRTRRKKKVVSPLSHVSRSRATKKNVEPVKADKSESSLPAASHPGEDDMHSEEKTVSVGMVLVCNVDLQSSPNEVTALLDHNNVDESKVSEKDGTDINSGGSHVCNTKRKRNSSTHLLGSSSPLKTTKVDEGTELADRSIDLHTILNSDKSPVELQNGSTFTGIGQVGDISQQSCRNEPLALLQNGLVKGYLEAKLSVGGNVNTNLSSPEEIKIHEDHVNLYSTFYDVQNASSSGNELVRGKHKITVSDVDAVDAGSKFHEATGLPEGVAVDAGSEATLLPESVEVEGIPSPLVEGNAIVGLSKAEGTNNREGVFDPYCFNHYATSTSGSDNFPSKSQWKIPVSEICSLDDSSKESCPEGATVLPENAPTEGLTKARMSVGGNLHVGFGKGGTPNKRKDMDIQLDFSSPSTSDMPVNMVNIVYPIDTSFSCSDKDLNFAQEKVVVSGADNFDVGSQPCTDKDSIVHGTSRKYIKKRKVCVPVSPSPVLPETQEEPVSGGTFMFNVELPSNTDGDLMLSENRIVESNIDTVHSARFPACSESTSVLIGNTEARPSFEATSFVGEGFTDNVSKLKQESCCPSGLGVEQKEKDDLVMITMNHQIDILDMERGGRGEKEVAAKDVEEPGMLHIDTVQQRDPSETQAPDTAQRQPVTDMECESYLLVKDGLPSVSNTLPLYADGKGISTTNLCDEMVEFAPDKLSNMDSPEAQSIVTGSQMFNAKISLGQIPNEKSCEDVGEQDEKHVFEGLSSSYSLNTSLQTINKKSGHAVGNVHSVNAKFQTQEARKTTHGLNSTSGAINMRNNQLTSAVPRVFPGYSSSKKTAPSSHITKPRTWHRTGNLSASSHLAKNSYLNSVPPQGQSSRKIGKDQNAYIRKGNSIVRKPSSVAAAPKFSYALSSSIYRLNPTKTDDMKNRTGVKSSVDTRNTPSSLQTGLNATLERPKTPPLPCSTKLSHCTTFSSGNGAPSSLADLPSYGCTNTESDPLKLKEITDVSKPSEDAPNSSGTHENQTGQINNFESQSVQDDGNSESRKARKMVYVKKKSNQLVAASSSSDLSVLNVDKTEALPSDGYYKSRKNQLIRKSLEITQNFAMPDVSLNSEWKKAPRVIASSSSRRRSGKGLSKSYKPSKFSLVWTLRDAESLKKENASLRQMLPHLFPWKRATHWRSLMHSSASVSNNSSLSTISRELLLSRKRETVYTRSTRGFSLRISKVLSVGGSSLKWSKSIEKNSKRANEEATLAVAAVAKKKREQNGAGAVTTAGTKNRNHSSRKSVHSIELRPGERIFRVGSFRYKMDPTRRTLQRISDEELSDSVALQSGKDLEKSSVPKRLLIGNDEYVRIGNGNQLIRDPKKRTRILASEKVRWSLHTARLRLARKSKYCQFFTRFGKCNKDDGKCPYIHDPSKIAVCTKFLKGSCSDPNCKLTHKVIPERMQDCSYFLQGLCTNESCPYRHVNVKANASICEGFLRGYCADGNECRKKHSYVCPIFEATGICTQGSKCKLHHPKNRNKGKKRKPSSGEQKNARGRYFGSRNRNVDVSSEYRTAVSEKHCAKDDDNVFYQEGRFSDYINLGICDEEVGEINDPSSDQTTVFEGELTDILLDVDELIKPTYVVNRRMMTESLKTAGNVSVESSSR